MAKDILISSQFSDDMRNIGDIKINGNNVRYVPEAEVNPGILNVR
jgi:hypothetical protein